MNKAEILIVTLLVALLIALGYTQKPPQQAPHAAPDVTYGATNVAAATSPASTTSTGVVALTGGTVQTPALTAVAQGATNASSTAPADAIAVDPTPEQTGTLSNALLTATITSHGGGIRSVIFSKFQAEHHAESLLTLDFSNSPALSLSSQGWVSSGDAIISGMDNDSVSLTFKHSSGLLLTRELHIGGDYLIGVKDTISNPTALPQKLTGYSLETGPMHAMGSATRGSAYMVMGIDSLSAHGGKGVHYWGKELATALFGLQSAGCRAVDASGAPTQGSYFLKDEAEWISAKNKFFVQMLLSKTATDGIQLKAERDVAQRSLTISSVSAGFRYPDLLLSPSESQVREAHYYVGPKSLSILKKLGRDASKTMEFGTYIGRICEWLLTTLNAIHSVIPNYGVAIILLTVVVRLLLWPITAKSTQSMKRMKELQPKLEAIQLKYKDKPQKMNEERMALFKAEKVNPMAGCLPMFFQLPVFFALYSMLQSAIELRFAPFLWIHDLSDSEHLFSQTALFHVFPFSIMHGLNILPLLMTGTTLWQMKLTPASGDAQQRQMMFIMPFMMMFMMYNMASGLMLYWTTSTLISILQTKVTNSGAPAVTAPIKR